LLSSPRFVPGWLLFALVLWSCGSPGKPGKTAPEDKSAEPAPATKDGKRVHDAVVCAGDQDIELRAVHIEVEDVAIHAKGSCRIKVIDSEIIAGDVAIVVSGSAAVELSGSRVRGARAALVIAGTGHVQAKATRFAGGRSITGGGEFQDGGENSWE